MSGEGGGNEPVYRPRGTGGMDDGTRRLVLIASGIGLFLLVVVGGWSLGGRHGAAGGGIPVIGPDPGPIKVKPANPGGLQLSGAEPPPANDDNAGGPSLAPGPEKPDPAALQAELDAARRAAAPPAPAAPSPPPAAVAPSPALVATPPPLAAPSMAPPAAPASLPAVASPRAPAASPTVAAAAPPHPAPAATAPAGVAVQLAAVDTEAAAHAQWSRLAHAHPGLLDNRAPLILRAQVGEKTFYRLRTGGFATIAAATAFCADLRAAGAACTLATF